MTSREEDPEEGADGRSSSTRPAPPVHPSVARPPRGEAERRAAALLSVVSHELKNHLGVLSLSSATLLRSAGPSLEPQAVRRAAERIERATERMIRAVNDLLDQASLDQDQLRLERGAHPVSDILGTARDARSAPATARGSSIELDLREELQVHCDRRRIVQVLCYLLDHLLERARESAAEPANGGGETSTIHLRVRPAGDAVRFEVQDPARVTPEGELPRMFQPFWRAGRGRGLGLNLSLASGIVQAHGAELELETRPELGSLFWFVLPRA